MIKFRNGWFHSTDLANVAEVVRRTAQSEPGKWVENTDTIDCKYIEIRIDMRTGDFCLKNAFGELLTLKQIQLLFPEISIEPFSE